MSYIDHVESDIIENTEEMHFRRHNRVTQPLLTKYEKARILGVRATQISKGTKPTIDIKNMKDALKIAEYELKHGDIPLIIRRHLPDGGYEDWTLKELLQK